MRKYFLTVMIFSVFSAIVILRAESSEVSKPVQPVISYPVKHDTSPPLRSIPPIQPEAVEIIREIPLFPLINKLPKPPVEELLIIDYVEQYWHGIMNMPAPIQNFEGVNNRNFVLPPDTNGDVGPNHYVQMVNLSFAIWNKTGTLLYGPANNNTLWSGFGGPCETYNDGDPIVLYDRMADRWLMSQFAVPGGATGYHQCIAISQTGDPTGAWYRYDFLAHATKLNDYPKFGIWPDGYYMSVNQFTGLTWAGAGAFAFERDKMLLGQSAQMIYFDLYSIDPWLGGMLPSHLNGSTLPPAGSPNYFVQFDDDAWGYSQDQLEAWQLHVDWTTPANSTFTGPTLLATAPFDSNLCNYSRNCIPQPGTGVRVDAISDLLMYSLQYRNFGTYQSILVNHTVDVGSDRAGIRWYELRNSGSGWTIYQQGTYAPDSNHRWMGSIAMDSRGNIALGYSVSSSSVYPSIRYAGRLASDPLNTLPQAEATLIDGSGSQTHYSGRWGDYSLMSVDPTDDCTFWYTQEYYQTTSSAGWQTRIGSFTVWNFSDVSPAYWAYDYIKKMYCRKITEGCSTSPLNYCPEDSVTRDQMAVFIIESMVEAGLLPSNFTYSSTPYFTDVPATHWAFKFIQKMKELGITGGCGGGNYCPDSEVTRSQMAVFITKALGEVPSTSCTGMFNDVNAGTVGDAFCRYIEKFATLGITSGCSSNPPLYCPGNPVTRAQMAVFLTSAFLQ